MSALLLRVSPPQLCLAATGIISSWKPASRGAKPRGNLRVKKSEAKPAIQNPDPEGDSLAHWVHCVLLGGSAGMEVMNPNFRS